MIETIKTLCRLSGPSGAEEPVRQYLLQRARPHADEIRQDAMGNLLVFKRGRKRPTRTILLAAHMDEVGVIVKSATDDGFLRFAFVGGVDRRVVIGKRVFLGPERVSAVVGMKPIHLASAGERKKIPPLEQLYLDLGADSRAEAERLAAPGTYGVFDDTLTELDGDMLSVKALDDRVGCGVMLSLLQQELPVDTWFAFTVCEEVGCRGAFGAAFGLKPEIALVLEGTTAADLPGVTGAKRVCAPGQGPVLPFMDGGTVYDRALFEQLRDLAERHHIPWQTKRRIAGGTDAQAIQKTGVGCRVAAISAAIRYIHSPVSVGCTRDFLQMKQLAELFLEEWT